MKKNRKFSPKEKSLYSIQIMPVFILQCNHCCSVFRPKKIDTISQHPRAHCVYIQIQRVALRAGDVFRGVFFLLSFPALYNLKEIYLVTILDAFFFNAVNCKIVWSLLLIHFEIIQGYTNGHHSIYNSTLQRIFQFHTEKGFGFF